MSDDPLRLADRIAIAELRARYTHHYDDHDLDAFVELFADDALMQLGPIGWARGRADIRAAIAGTMATVDFACHFTGDEITEFTSDDTALGTSRFAVHCGHSPVIQGAGTYRDEYRRTPDGWRFASRTISFFYMGTPTAQWPPTPPPLGPPPG
jgi:ketosteroid isomerase-like protein